MALSPEVGTPPQGLVVGEELLPDSGPGLHGEVTKDKKGVVLPRCPRWQM